jgi:hypothetical protein
MKVKLRSRSKPEKEGTSRNRDANTVLGAKKPGPDMNLTWPSTIEGNQNKKQNKGVWSGGHTTLHTLVQEFTEGLEVISHPNEEQKRLRKFSNPQPYGCKVESFIQNNPTGQILRGRITKVNGDLHSTG